MISVLFFFLWLSSNFLYLMQVADIEDSFIISYIRFIWLYVA